MGAAAMVGSEGQATVPSLEHLTFLLLLVPSRFRTESRV